MRCEEWGNCAARVYERSPCETMGHFALESPFLYLKYNPESALFQDGIIHKETVKSLCTPQMDEKAKLCYNRICWGALDAPAEMEDAPSMGDSEINHCHHGGSISFSAAVEYSCTNHSK